MRMRAVICNLNNPVALDIHSKNYPLVLKAIYIKKDRTFWTEKTQKRVEIIPGLKLISSSFAPLLLLPKTSPCECPSLSVSPLLSQNSRISFSFRFPALSLTATTYSLSRVPSRRHHQLARSHPMAAQSSPRFWVVRKNIYIKKKQSAVSHGVYRY